MPTPMRRYWTLFLRGTRLLRRPPWRRGLRRWLATHVEPLLVSTRGEEHLRETLDLVAGRLSFVLSFLDLGPSVLDDRRFAGQLLFSLSPVTFSPEIVVRDARLRAYCDISATLAMLDPMLRELAAELSVDELEAATRLAAVTSRRREMLIAAGRRLLAAGRYDEAAANARRALDIMSACPSSQKLLMDALRARRDAGGAITPVEENGLADLRGRFCARPFEVIVSGQGMRWNDDAGTTEQVMGATYPCDCAAWVPYVTGNMLEGESADGVWNSPGMQEMRRSILDGDFSYCSRTLCPVIANAALPRKEDVTSPRLRRIIDANETVVTDGPPLVALGHDSSCNLACPTCRADLVMANREQSERLDVGRDRVILPMLRNQQTTVHLTSWGDPFASRHYRSILEALREPEYDGVRLIILTNGLGLTPHTWKAMPHLAEKIIELRVSIDAASKETYENVRRPGRWDVLRENLTAMAEVNRAGTFRRNRARSNPQALLDGLPAGLDQSYSFMIAFVVQSANFREMPAFVRLGEELGATVVFQKYYSFGHEPPEVFAAKDITSSAHPEHEELQAILRDSSLHDPHVLRTFHAQLETRTA